MTDEEVPTLPSSSTTTLTDEDLIPPTAVPKPDRNAFTKAENDLLNEITAFKEKQTRIYSKIDAIDKAKEEFQSTIKEARNKLQAAKLEADRAKEVRESLLKAREDARNALEKLTNEAKNAKKNMKFSNLESIEARIQELNDRQHTTNMNLKEEKELIREIESLNAARTTLQRVKDVEARATAASSEHKTKGKDLENQITIAIEIHNAAKAKRDTAFEEVKRLQDAHNAAVNNQTNAGNNSNTGSSSSSTTAAAAAATNTNNAASKKTELIKEKQENYEAMRAKETALKALRDEFFSANRNYNNYLMAMRRYQQVLASKAAAENAKNGTNVSTGDATTPGTAADLESIPAFYAKELKLCDVLTTFLTKLKPKEKTGPTEAERAQAAAEQSKRITNSLVGLNGEKLTVTARSTGDDDGLYTVSKNKKDTKKDTKKNTSTKDTHGTTASTASSAPSVSQITLDLEVLNGFETLSITAPLTTADIDTTLQALKSKRKYYETAPPPPHEKSTATTETTGSNAGSNARASGNRTSFTNATNGSKRTGKGLHPKLSVGSSVQTPYGPGTLVTTERGDGLVTVKLEVKETGFYATAILDPELVKPGKHTSNTVNTNSNHHQGNHGSSTASTTASSSNAPTSNPWNSTVVRPTAEIPTSNAGNAPTSPGSKSTTSPRTGRSNRPGTAGVRSQRKD